MNSGDDLIADYLDDALTDEHAAEFQEWLREDDFNMRQFLLAVARDEQLRSAVLAQESFAVAKEQTAPRSSVKKPLRRYISWSVAACIVLLVACWLVGLRTAREPGVTLVESSGLVSRRTDAHPQATQFQTGETLSVGTVAVEGEGARASFTYADGVQFSLATGSELAVESGTDKKLFLRRGVLLATAPTLRGDQPLFVRTPTAEATVVGTSFGISAGRAETLLRVKERCSAFSSSRG